MGTSEKLFRHIKHAKKRRFLRAVIETGGNMTLSAEAAGVSQCTPYSKPWKTDEAFQAALVEAKEEAGEVLEAEAVRRALKGSDVLLIFLLKGRYPERYRDNVKVAGSASEPLASSLEVRYVNAPDPAPDD